MCLSNNRTPNRPVTFEDTILYGAEYKDPAGVLFHVLGYFNKVSVKGAGNGIGNGTPADSDAPTPTSRPTRRGSRGLGMIAPQRRRGRTQSSSGGDDFGWDEPAQVAKSGNAMLFAIPAKAGTVDESCLIPVSDIPNFMKDLKKAVAPQPRVTRGGLRRGAADFGAKSLPIVVHNFDNGTYEVVIAPSASSIASVISQVPKAKRPTANAELYAQLDKLYKGWTFVLFCFSEQDAEQAGCALIKYQPQREDLLYLPGLDGHDGSVEWGPVAVAHTVVVSSYKLQNGPNVNDVDYSDADVAKKHPYLFGKVLGKVVSGDMPQGDFLCKIADVRAGSFRCKRQLPPGTPRSVARGEAFYI